MYEELQHSFKVLKPFQKSARTSKHLANILEHPQLFLDQLFLDRTRSPCVPTSTKVLKFAAQRRLLMVSAAAAAEAAAAAAAC